MNLGDMIRYETGGQLGIVIDVCPAPSQASVNPPWITVSFPSGVCGPMSSRGFEIVSKQ